MKHYNFILFPDTQKKMSSQSSTGALNTDAFD